MSQAEKSLEPALLKRLLRYEPVTGRVFWRERTPSEWSASPARLAAWNRQFAGKEAFKATGSNGYFCGRIGFHVNHGRRV